MSNGCQVMYCGGAGDDPNYWLALTHQAERNIINKKVKRMLSQLHGKLAREVGATQVPSPMCCSC